MDSIQIALEKFEDFIYRCKEHDYELRCKWHAVYFICARPLTEEEKQEWQDYGDAEVKVAIVYVPVDQLEKFKEEYDPIAILVEYQAQEGNPSRFFNLSCEKYGDPFTEMEQEFKLPVIFDICQRDQYRGLSDIKEDVASLLIDYLGTEEGYFLYPFKNQVYNLWQ